MMLVFGTRPEAIKMAPLCRALLDRKSIRTVICVSAQHREMLDQVLSIFNLSPDIDLDVMKKDQDLFDITSSILLRMRDVLRDERPDLVLVHGDTTTTFATSLACFYEGIKLGHVEAGLRTNDISAPFPEEYNRRNTSLVADYHFAPTEISRRNLIDEGISDEKVIVTGNTVIDSLLMVLENISRDAGKLLDMSRRLGSRVGFNLDNDRFILITGHRRENFGNGFLEICEAIKTLALKHGDCHFLYPVHLNPNVQGPVCEILSDTANVYLIEPLEYEEFVFILQRAFLVLTDSGGIQEEAPSLGKPVLVMREVTERPEAVQAGTVRLVGASKEKIIREVDALLTDPKAYSRMARAHNPYGNGSACELIVNFIEENLSD